MSLMGWTMSRWVANTSLWKTICHWTRLSGEKKEEACIGSCSFNFGLRGRPLGERQGEGASMEKSMRGSAGWESCQPCCCMSCDFRERSHL